MTTRLSAESIESAPSAMVPRELDEIRKSERASVTSFTTRTTTSRSPLYKHVTTFQQWDDAPSTFFLIPRKLFNWIYSISLVIFVLITVLFAAITIIDVIAQSSSTRYSAIKLFLVIIVCVAFIVYSLIVYFSRLLQARIALNDIPSKSAYIPFEGDYPKAVFREIDKTLQKCCEIKAKSDPKFDKSIVLDHPGLSPPEYIQQRNMSLGIIEGTLLPPESHYEEIIRSIGDYFILGKLINPEIPKHYTFREILIYLHTLYVRNNDIELLRLIELYERFRFGPDLITQSELIEFILEFDKLAQIFLSDYKQQLNEPKKRSTKTVYDDGYSAQDLGYYNDNSTQNLGNFADEYSQSLGYSDEYNSKYDDFEDDSRDKWDASEVDSVEIKDGALTDKGCREYTDVIATDADSTDQSFTSTKARPKSELSGLYPPSTYSSSGLRKNSSIRSSTSFIQNKLALRRGSNISADSIIIKGKDLDYDEHRNTVKNKEKEELEELMKTQDIKSTNNNIHFDDLFASSSEESNEDSNEFYSFRKRPR